MRAPGSRRSCRALIALAVGAAWLCAGPTAAALEPGVGLNAPAARTIVVPDRIPVGCVQVAASDYSVPAVLLLAMLKVESGGRSVVSSNANGTQDIGMAQHNSASWVPYLERRYGITAGDLLRSPCQSIRAQAYVLRREMNTRECGGFDLWCGVARYHSPGNANARKRYVARVHGALTEILESGRFESRGGR